MDQLVKLLLLEKGFDPKQGIKASWEKINAVFHGRDEGMILLDGRTTKLIEIQDRKPLFLQYKFNSIAMAKEGQEMAAYSPSETIRNKRCRTFPLAPEMTTVQHEETFNDGAVTVGTHQKFMHFEGPSYTVTLQTLANVAWAYLPKAEPGQNHFLDAVVKAAGLEDVQTTQANKGEPQWYTGTLSGLDVSLSSNDDRHLLLFHKPGMWPDRLREMMIKTVQQFSGISTPVQDFPPGTVKAHYNLPPYIPSSAAVAEVELGLGFQIPAYLSKMAERLKEI